MATSQVQREEGEKFILVGTVFDDYVPQQKLKEMVVEHRVYSIGLFASDVDPEKLNTPYITVRSFGDFICALRKYPTCECRSVSMRDKVPIETIANNRKIVLAESCDIDNALTKYKDIILEAWKCYRMPQFHLINGEYVYRGNTNRYISLINKKEWAYSIYMFFKVLCDEYTIKDYREKQESYGKDVRDRCAFCKTDPPKSVSDYTETRGNCSRCNIFVCGNHLYRKSRSRSYYCPRCL